MFGLLDRFKYRSEVTVEIHAILKLIPQLGDLLKTFPGRNDAINEFRKKKTPEIEAAAWLSLVVIEKVMLEIPAETRLLTLQQLDHKKDDMFRWFGKTAQTMLNGQAEHPKEMPNLAVALGFAFWYLGFAVREHKLSEHDYQVFIEDVIGMLRGQSQSERRSNRLRGALFPGR